MKKLMTICFALALTFGVASARDMQNDNMQADASKKAVQVTGKISDDGKTFVSDKDSKSWTITNPDAVKGHEGHHVTLTAHVYADKNEVHVMSLQDGAVTAGGQEERHHAKVIGASAVQARPGCFPS
jgi:hypothetical protein